MKLWFDDGYDEKKKHRNKKLLNLINEVLNNFVFGKKTQASITEDETVGLRSGGFVYHFES